MSAALDQVIEKADHWRGSSPSRRLAVTQVPFKEWQHFVIFGQGWLLVFNLNLDGPLNAAGANPKARVITIYSDQRWLGQVDKCHNPTIRRGKIDAEFDNAGMRWREGAYEIWQHGPGITFEVELTPTSIPSLTHNIPLGSGCHLSWCLTPRLSANGWLCIDGKKTAFENLSAYHDHNWGQFHWGGDFSWEWGCAFPDDPQEPWALVFARMNSKDRNAITATSAFLLHRGKHLRYFRNTEVDFLSSDKSAAQIAGRIPSTAALLLPDEDHDVAQTMTLNARRGADWINTEIVSKIRGQVLVPSEVDYCKLVRLNEASARVKVSGSCAGHAIDFEGPGLLEVVRA